MKADMKFQIAGQRFNVGTRFLRSTLSVEMPIQNGNGG